MNARPNDPRGPNQPTRPLLPEKAREVCSLLGLDVGASPLLREGMTAEEFLTALIEQGQLRDAITFPPKCRPDTVRSRCSSPDRGRSLGTRPQ